jgi:hypothetical protein
MMGNFHGAEENVGVPIHTFAMEPANDNNKEEEGPPLSSDETAPLMKRMALMETQLRMISQGKTKEIEDLEDRLSFTKRQQTETVRETRQLAETVRRMEQPMGKEEIERVMESRLIGFENQLEKFSRIAATAFDQGEQMLMAFSQQSEVIEHLRNIPGGKKMVLEKAEDDSQCLICMDGERTHAFLHGDFASAHGGFCETCASRIVDAQQPCPTCRQPIGRMIKMN